MQMPRDVSSTRATVSTCNKMNSDRADGHNVALPGLTVLDSRSPVLFFPESDFIYTYLHVFQK